MPLHHLHDTTDIVIHSTTDILTVTEKELKQYDYILIQRGLGDLRPIAWLREKDYTKWKESKRQIEKAFIEKVQAAGVKIIFDIDDYWVLQSGHQAHRQWEYIDQMNSVETFLRCAAVVWVPTDILRVKAKLYNKNVHVIPNAIYDKHEQYRLKPTQSSRVRFGWFGGIFHREDVELLRDGMAKVYSDQDLIDKVQICLAGFNYLPAGQMESTEENDKAHMNGYGYYEYIFTDRYTHFSEAYKSYLNQRTPVGNHLANGEPYKRIWGREVDQYVEGYNEIDVALAPLKDNTFNSCKSQLKIIEAGWMGKAVICSDTLPYTLDVISEENGILVKEKRGHKDWYRAIKRLTEDEGERLRMAKNLHDMVHDTYTIQKANEKRVASLQPAYHITDNQSHDRNRGHVI